MQSGVDTYKKHKEIARQKTCSLPRCIKSKDGRKIMAEEKVLQ